ncbi:MAG: hypothetical protein ACRDPO_00205 [Streptosporangiaceae bacterium]
MRLSGEILGWTALAMGTLGTVWWLTRLVLPRPSGRLAHPGAHVRPAGLAGIGRRGWQWRDLRYPLVLVAVGVGCLTTDSADSRAWWLQLGLAPFLLVWPAWDLTSWLRSRVKRRPGGPAPESP